MDQYFFRQGRRYDFKKHSKNYEAWLAQLKQKKSENTEYKVTNYINYLENKFDSKYDIELAEYYRDQYQYLTSLSLKEQLEILVDRFEWFLHEPTILLLDRILYKDPTRNPYMMGNFAPVESENDAYLLTEISGKIPTDINGVYLRNGPNPLYIPSNGR